MSLVRSSGRVPTGHADEVVISESSFRSGHRAHEANNDPNFKKRKREERGDTSVVYGPGAFKGPWARYDERRPDADDDSGEEIIEYVEEDESAEEEEAVDKAQPTAVMPRHSRKIDKSGTAYADDVTARETTEFHGEEERDYQGRTYMHIPQDLDIDLRRPFPLEERKNYHPKRQIHVWKSHTKAITQTRFFPSSGHLMLSASADCTVKLWDVYHSRSLLRTFKGHNKSVNDIDFDADGTHFLSASYDRYTKLWDTETGTCTARFTNGSTPHVIRFNPSRPAEFLAGMSDHKILQWDTRTPDAKPVQEYDYHLGPVNTLTFCDEDRRFVSTSDDKSIRAWEYGIPVQIKYIAEPHMYPLVRASPHPTGKYAAFQSSDNQIVVYSTGDKFRQNRKKDFRGHNNAGYAIDVAISPDGGIVASGDSAGYVCFWDWKTCKMYHKIQTGERGVACVSVSWNPRESSKVVTGGLDGMLRYWD